ncbi:unnamed protein product [Phaeothamnion confervicola]
MRKYATSSFAPIFLESDAVGFRCGSESTTALLRSLSWTKQVPSIRFVLHGRTTPQQMAFAAIPRSFVRSTLARDRSEKPQAHNLKRRMRALSDPSLPYRPIL